MLSDVSRAEELRIFCVRGWRAVWNDIIDRWESATPAPRSEKASKILDRYAADPSSMRRGPVSVVRREKVVTGHYDDRSNIIDALRRRSGNGIL